MHIGEPLRLLCWRRCTPLLLEIPRPMLKPMAPVSDLLHPGKDERDILLVPQILRLLQLLLPDVESVGGPVEDDFEPLFGGGRRRSFAVPERGRRATGRCMRRCVRDVKVLVRC